MKYLDLTECKVRPVTLGSPGNGEECLLDLTSHCYDLEKLSLAKLNLSNPRWLENIVQNSHTLRVLDLGYCTGSCKAKHSMVLKFIYSNKVSKFKKRFPTLE